MVVTEKGENIAFILAENNYSEETSWGLSQAEVKAEKICCLRVRENITGDWEQSKKDKKKLLKIKRGASWKLQLKSILASIPEAQISVLVVKGLDNRIGWK